MRRMIALLLTVALLVGVATPAAYAGTATDIALGLASFAVFNQIVRPLLQPREAYATPHVTKQVIYTTPPAVYAPAPVVTVPPPPPMPTVVHYPHGRHELRGDGVTTHYHWVWIPNPPPPPPPPALSP